MDSQSIDVASCSFCFPLVAFGQGFDIRGMNLRDRREIKEGIQSKERTIKMI